MRNLSGKTKDKCPKKWTWNNETQACYRAYTHENLTMLEADELCEGAPGKPILAHNQWLKHLIIRLHHAKNVALQI